MNDIIYCMGVEDLHLQFGLGARHCLQYRNPQDGERNEGIVM